MAAFLISCLFIYVVYCFLLYFFLTFKSAFFVYRSTVSRVLIVTAHPDDECMFFGPTINYFRKEAACRLLILCLSTGNYYKMGNIRKKELMRSCSVLGLEKSAIKIIEDSKLPDDPDIEWDTRQIAEYIKKHVKNHLIDKIVTFDSHGVSKHRNHVSIFKAVQLLKKSGELPETQVLLLRSVSTLIKYLSILSLPVVHIYHKYSKSCLIISTPLQVFRTQRAMIKHWSQMVWFRVFYIYLSQYMLINDIYVLT